MKKLVLMAVMMVASATAFAGDSDALKAILKAKTYDEAQALLNSSLAQLASDQEKAKAYNKLVDLAYEKFKKEDDTRLTNQALQKNDPIDTEGMVKAGINALNYALECNKYDILPDAKNRVKPAFQKKNQDRLQNVRIGLLNQGFQYANEQKNQETFDCLDLYLSSGEQPLFSELEAVKNDANRGAAAFYAGRAALQLEKNARAAEIFKIGVQDTAKQVHDLCFELLIYTLGKTRVTAADSAKYLNDMKELYAQYPENEMVYASYSDAVNATGDEAGVMKIAADHLAKYPNAVLPHVYQAFVLQGQKKYAEAIAEWDKVPETQNNYVQFVYYRAVCKYNMAADFNEKNADIRTGRLTPDNDKKYREMLTDAQKDFEKAQELDPDQLNVKWGYLLKNIYIATGQQEKADAIL
ncbi:MAG: hypothetical protein IJ569_08455 [Prevotella sp.]|nr:hypothetical protein [Prevotella sp.]